MSSATGNLERIGLGVKCIVPRLPGGEAYSLWSIELSDVNRAKGKRYDEVSRRDTLRTSNVEIEEGQSRMSSKAKGTHERGAKMWKQRHNWQVLSKGLSREGHEERGGTATYPSLRNTGSPNMTRHRRQNNREERRERPGSDKRLDTNINSARRENDAGTNVNVDTTWEEDKDRQRKQARHDITAARKNQRGHTGSSVAWRTQMKGQIDARSIHCPQRERKLRAWKNKTELLGNEQCRSTIDSCRFFLPEHNHRFSRSSRRRSNAPSSMTAHKALDPGVVTRRKACFDAKNPRKSTGLCSANDKFLAARPSGIRAPRAKTRPRDEWHVASAREFGYWASETAAGSGAKAVGSVSVLRFAVVRGLPLVLQAKLSSWLANASWWWEKRRNTGDLIRAPPQSSFIRKNSPGCKVGDRQIRLPHVM
ncbi:hypothetical protein C8F04DRAFT_1180674 [Mycena alexandri]|uniref:Uncharacterized protein n=1 Tax=Mycena alexandri TaxID=1745969 RepID=A0AAD6X369_9AGAR|nr:hypothetical protein C8F04DRAFT_1180674 [Mycena alexandri]